MKYIVIYQEPDWFRPRKSEPLTLNDALARKEWHEKKPYRMAWLREVKPTSEKGEG